jgi:hypothetical protein
MKQYKNTVQIIQNTVNTSTHFTKTPTQGKRIMHETAITYRWRAISVIILPP